MTPQELVIALVTAVFVDYDIDAARPLMAPDYIQHNPGIPTGADGLLKLIPIAKDIDLTVTTHRLISEGDIVVAHNTFENAEAFGAPTLVSFDVFRVDDGVLVEHWDNLQVPPSETASGRTMTDGPTEIADLEKTAANTAVVTGFVTDVFLNGKLEKAPEYINPAPGAYHQHNPLVPDGLAAVGAAFTQLQEAGQGFSFSELHMVVAEGKAGAMGLDHLCQLDRSSRKTDR